LYSDDHGQSWKLGGTVAPFTNECQVVELADGALLINMRNYWGSEGKEPAKGKKRAVAHSRDGGQTWQQLRFDDTLVEPICQASLHRVIDAQGKGRLIFSNPASADRRHRLTVRLSHDDGRTWPNARLLEEGPAAYSCLADLPDGSLACLYERGQKDPYEKITLARFTLDWLAGEAGAARGRPRVVAHRGLAGHAPENTLAAYRACLDLRIGLELDVRRARDGTLVCIHDATLDRTTRGSGKVEHYTAAELARLDAGSWFDPAFHSERIPTLDQAFALLARYPDSPALVAIDLKEADTEADVVRLAKQHGVLDRLVFIGRAISLAEVRHRLRQADAKTHVARLALTAEDLDAASRDADADWIYVRFLPSRDEVARIHAAGKRIFLSGPKVAGRQIDTWKQAAAHGIDAILTDFPLDLAALLRTTPVNKP
jgi:glycerophosphoryl diester phosphodiesterase